MTSLPALPRVLHLTDLHLQADPTATLKGVRTLDALEQLLDEARRELPDPARVVITGDIAHDERAETYEHLRRALGDWVDICRIVPGNHDNRDALAAVLPEAVQRGQAGRVVFSERVGAWHLIGLDTHVPGREWGRIGEAQLAWLERELGSAPTVLFLHHPPLKVGTPWLEFVGLRESDALLALARGCACLRAIFHGHAHQELEGRLERGAQTGPDAVPVFGTPATCFQFKKGALLPRIDTELAPGYRVLELSDELHTQVRRLSTVAHGKNWPGAASLAGR